MEQVRLGIIGIGGMGTEHAKGLLAGKVPELKLTAVADIRPARLKYAREHIPEVPVTKEEKETDRNEVCTGANSSSAYQRNGGAEHEA